VAVQVAVVTGVAVRHGAHERDAARDMNATIAAPLSIIRGPPLCDEPGLGALTLPGYLREVTSQYAEREALVIHHHNGTVQRWTYSELWERAMAVACALIDCGVGKDSRVGVLSVALASPRFPFLRRLVGLGDKGPAGIQTWTELLDHGVRDTTVQIVQARVDSVKPADAGALFFSSGSTGNHNWRATRCHGEF